MKQIFSIYFQRKYSTQCVIQLFLLISAHELCPMSYAKSHALYVRKDSKTYCSILCSTSLERYIYISYRCFGKPSVVNFNWVFFHIYIFNSYYSVLSLHLEATCSQQPEGSIHNDSSAAPRISACFCCWHDKTKSVHFNFLTYAYFIPACQLHENVTKKTLI